MADLVDDPAQRNEKGLRPPSLIRNAPSLRDCSKQEQQKQSASPLTSDRKQRKQRNNRNSTYTVSVSDQRDQKNRPSEPTTTMESEVTSESDKKYKRNQTPEPTSGDERKPAFASKEVPQPQVIQPSTSGISSRTKRHVNDGLPELNLIDEGETRELLVPIWDPKPPQSYESRSTKEKMREERPIPEMSDSRTERHKRCPRTSTDSSCRITALTMIGMTCLMASIIAGVTFSQK